MENSIKLPQRTYTDEEKINEVEATLCMDIDMRL